MSFIGFAAPFGFPQRRAKARHSAPAAALLPKPPFPLQRLLGPALMLLLWYVASGAGWISPARMPVPGTVIASFADMARSGTFLTDILASLRRAALGLSIGIVAGFALALMSGLTRLGDALIDSNVQVKRAMRRTDRSPPHEDHQAMTGLRASLRLATLALVSLPLLGLPARAEEPLPVEVPAGTRIVLADDANNVANP